MTRNRLSRPANLVEHARRELKTSGQVAEDPAYAAHLIAAVAAFASYGHSGGSAVVAVGQLTRLLQWEPLTPITDNPEEWQEVAFLDDAGEVADRGWWQNIRDSRALSRDGGKTWTYTEGRHAGEHTEEDGTPGTLVNCETCGGRGTRLQPDPQ